MINAEAKQSVPEGYKQTEVGVIPEDWGAAPLGDLLEPQITKKSLKSKDKVTFIGMQDVTEDAQLVSPKVIDYGNIKTGFTYFEKNDVLVAKITPCFENGKGCHAQNIHTDVGFGSTEFHVLRATKYSEARFIYFWSTRRSFRKSLELEMVGSAGHRRVPFLALCAYKIPLPPRVEEQAAIANALSDADTLISELEKLIAKKQAIKTATMQQLLTGRTRLPQFALREDGTKKGTKPSELGEIPEDWEVVQLGDCSAYIGSGKTNTKFTGDFPLYGSTGLIGSCAKPEYSGDALLVARVGANAGRLNFVSGEYGVSDNTIIIKLKSGNNIAFFKYWLIRKNLNTLIFGSGQPLITGTQLKGLAVPLPSENEQTAIALILSDMDAQIQALGQRLAKTRKIKQGMMQELLTGKTRLLRPQNTASTNN